MPDFTKKEEAINPYGDKPLSVSGIHGTDISSGRLDDLDKDYIRHILFKTTPPRCVDLGCGLATPSIAASIAGASVDLYDNLDLVNHFSELIKAIPTNRLTYNQTDLSSPSADVFPEKIDIVYSQRFIHYLPYNKACELLSLLRNRMPDDGRVFISASGLKSELGNDYPDKDQPVSKRFSKASKNMAEKHDIHSPLCMYTEDEFKQLLHAAGFDKISLYSSTFGNIKGIFQPRI